MHMTILEPGWQTMVQDLGRPGWRASGVSLGGAVDSLALRLANLAVGNAAGAAGLECTLVGPRVRFSEPALIAVGGATIAHLPSCTPVCIAAGDELVMSKFVGGCRAYLAVAGGIDVPPVLGSRSTELRCGWGGHAGRALRAGDVLKIGQPRTAVAGSRPDFETLIEPLPAQAAVRVIPGEAWEQGGRALVAAEYTVSSQSDRMGVRLQGPRLPVSLPPLEFSTPVTPGTIQIPPDGQPIVLLADAQALGGYPIAAHVISIDLRRIAQLRPGEGVAFAQTTLAEAHRLFIEQEARIAALQRG